jgi:hypothetical protein
MSAVPAALVKACRRLGGRPVVAVLVSSVSVALALFAACGSGLRLMLVSVAGLIAPLIGAATGPHLVLRRIGAQAQR